MSTGWLKLHRSLDGHWVGSRPDWGWAWVVILLRTDWRSGRVDLTAARPAAGMGARAWRWFVERLAADGMLLDLEGVSGRGGGRYATVANWRRYQGSERADSAEVEDESVTFASDSRHISRPDSADGDGASGIGTSHSRPIHVTLGGGEAGSGDDGDAEAPSVTQESASRHIYMPSQTQIPQGQGPISENLTSCSIKKKLEEGETATPASPEAPRASRDALEGDALRAAWAVEGYEPGSAEERMAARFATGRSFGKEAGEASAFFRVVLGASLAGHPQVRANVTRWFGQYEPDSIRAYWGECLAAASRRGKAPVFLFVDGLNGSVAAPTLRARPVRAAVASTRRQYTRDDFEAGMAVVTPEGDRGVVVLVDRVWLELEDGRSFRVTECVPVRGVAA